MGTFKLMHDNGNQADLEFQRSENTPTTLQPQKFREVVALGVNFRELSLTQKTHIMLNLMQIGTKTAEKISRIPPNRFKNGRHTCKFRAFCSKSTEDFIDPCKLMNKHPRKCPETIPSTDADDGMTPNDLERHGEVSPNTINPIQDFSMIHL